MYGSSPLARGTQEVPRAPGRLRRFIPAGAGNTGCQPLARPWVTVHPRWRGEHTDEGGRRGLASGSSPLARGTLVPQHDGVAGERFIPAGAGNTRSRFGGIRSRPVHPRWRGEHSPRARSLGRKVGSSPLARGTRTARQPGQSPGRFIPAGAGNTTKPSSPSARPPVHPRWRGEHGVSVPDTARLNGSSPLARGTHPYRDGIGRVHRFIPAGAGNTPNAVDAGSVISVHPRWRGEHNNAELHFLGTNGSSPLARGTRSRAAAWP
ncbi:hypothetical protein PPSAL_0770 [Ectopseudomonas oleovorans]|uniref:Uncharacterized protein n=1 Tax=Ectopseudomonas oleovorans (strain CECT 5344) TaxID=1182590 RepID=W6QR38_ECTO5|nr:hypothetical protein BN5_0776 [Pseudomonas oleovorans CECT 5344]CDR90006.1 hypothetical protein PPSAL_0770 [Pseudomonas oleovorans]